MSKQKHKQKPDEFKPFFKGYVSLPVTYDPNRDMDEQMAGRVRYTGDWVTKLKRITGKPRKYQITIRLNGYQGEKGETLITLKQADTFKELAGYIYEFTKQMLEDIETDGKQIKDIVNWERSYALIRA